jgi:hypothetical protein
VCTTHSIIATAIFLVAGMFSKNKLRKELRVPEPSGASCLLYITWYNNTTQGSHVHRKHSNKQCSNTMQHTHQEFRFLQTEFNFCFVFTVTFILMFFILFLNTYMYIVRGNGVSTVCKYNICYHTEQMVFIQVPPTFT